MSRIEKMYVACQTFVHYDADQPIGLLLVPPSLPYFQALRIAEDAATNCTASYRAPELYDPPQGATLDVR